MRVKVTKEAYDAWLEFSCSEDNHHRLSADRVEFDMPDEAYDDVVTGRLQGESLSDLFHRKFKSPHGSGSLILKSDEPEGD